ncbi:hypothetical protein PHISCL_01740 [Aspergillus sclerotialis]|uniref:Protein BFR2 n=1 Tax=Aspergillus sclerotialis TaxID=2070753 RepID=A0A3A2ZRY1_9EURO|nr:hypothetical protein PHISCL_01740 [Aspergillus sclerotialis]
MAPGEGKLSRSLKEQLGDLDDPTPKEFDPEEVGYGDQSSDDGDDGAIVDKNAGREHYQAVGRGKLRKEEPIVLGKQYAGSRVSREALEAESDEPFESHTSDNNTDDSSDEESNDETGGVDGRRASPPKQNASNHRDSMRNDIRVGLVKSSRIDEGKANQVDHYGINQTHQSRIASGGDNFEDVDMTKPFNEGGVETGHDLNERVQNRGLMLDHSTDNEVGDEESEDRDSHSLGRGSVHQENHKVDGVKRMAADRRHDDAKGEEDGQFQRLRIPDANRHGGQTEETKVVNERDELRKLMASDQKTIAETMSKAAKADGLKGKAVKQQRETFDALLSSRIKLQKSVTAANQVTGARPTTTSSSDRSTVQSAESAALALWSTLEDLRLALLNVQVQAKGESASKKRKRPTALPSDSTTSLWNRMADLENESVPHRRAILDKWSLKVRGSNATIPNTRGKLLGSGSGQQNITTVLDAQIATEVGDRTAKRARRESSNQDTPEPIYDDTIFYQSLLRDLVEQRMATESAGGRDALHIELPSRPSIHPITGMRNDKNRKQVDTRASKGRKMRFDVHEKLQNFMAPEDRGSWTDRARDEFFASLLGKTASGLLQEGDDESEESDDDREEGGLRLFRS